MKLQSPTFARRRAGITAVEVIVLLGIVLLVGFLVIPPMRPPRVHAPLIKCVNNLKNVGLAARIYANDDNGHFPFQNVRTNLTDLSRVSALQYFLTLSNELSTPKIINCPSDEDRKPADGWSNLRAENISYFVNLVADEENPQSVLGGDRNIMIAGKQIPAGVVEIGTNISFGWSREVHAEKGQIVMSDGSVQHSSSARLAPVFIRSEMVTNVLLVP